MDIFVIQPLSNHTGTSKDSKVTETNVVDTALMLREIPPSFAHRLCRCRWEDNIKE